MKDLITRLLDSWNSVGAIDKSLFSEDFIYTGPSKMVDAKTWLGMDDSLPATKLEIIDTVIEGNNGVILFECVDEFTQLRYRFCWFLKSNGEKLTKLIEVKEPVEI